MTLAEASDDISYALGVLTHQVSAENLAGLYSKNRLVEDILLPVFRILFGAPGLANTNLIAQGFPDIDLADSQQRLAIQVTTDRTAGKVTETLTGFVGRKAHKTY